MGKVINSPSYEITYIMAYKLKSDLYVPVVRQVALDNVPLRNEHSSQNFSEEPMFIFFYSQCIVRNIKSIPVK